MYVAQERTILAIFNMGSRNNTISKLTRWRVRNMAACFFSCNISEPADYSKDSNCYSSSVSMPRNALSFDPIGDGGREERRKKGRKQKLNKSKNDKEMPSSTSCQNKDGEKDDYSAESSRYCFKEEDQYIVFSFDSERSHGMINGKTQSEDDKQSHSSLEDISGLNIEESICQKVEGDENRHDGKMLSARESSDSVHSDTSTGSFAFPVVHPHLEMGMDGQPCSHAAAV